MMRDVAVCLYNSIMVIFLHCGLRSFILFYCKIIMQSNLSKSIKNISWGAWRPLVPDKLHAPMIIYNMYKCLKMKTKPVGGKLEEAC
jgi:hypothetical protein